MFFVFAKLSSAKILKQHIEDFEDQKIKLSRFEELRYLENIRSNWDSCPTSLVEKTEQDAKVFVRDKIGRKIGSSDEYCTNALSNLAETPQVDDLSKRLATNPLTALDEKGSTLSNRCIASVKDTQRQKFLVVEYHSNLARLKMASLASLESLASIDSVLGEKILSDVDCSKANLSQILKGCQQLQSCSSQKTLDAQAQEVEGAYSSYSSLKSELNRLTSLNSLSYTTVGPGFYVPTDKEISLRKERSNKIDELRKATLALETMYPVLGGKFFKKTLDPSKKNFSQALKAQLVESRKKIRAQLKEFQKGIDCMQGVGSCYGFEETLHKTPPLNIFQFKMGEGLSFEEGQVQSYLSAVDCRQKIREVKQNQDEAIKDFTVGTALAVATVGLGAYASYCRATVSSIKNSVFLPSIAKHSAAIDAAVNLSQKATFASRTILGFDLLTLGKNGLEAYDHCSKELNLLIEQKSKKNNSIFQVTCPSVHTEASAQPQLVANYRSCIVKSIMVGVTGFVLPADLRENIEGPFRGAIKIFKKGAGTFTNEKNKELDNEEFHKKELQNIELPSSSQE